jgi:hypothetical protein
VLGLAIGCTPAKRTPAETPMRADPVEHHAPAASPATPASSVADATAPTSSEPVPPPMTVAAPDPTGLVPPEPDASMTGLPVDARLPDWAAVLAHHRRDCNAFRPKPCELVADFDGDGQKDRAVKIRETSTRRSGIAIRWASGAVSVIGAGVATRQLSTDVHMEGVDLSWRETEDDFSFLEHWSVVQRSDAGFVGAGPKLRTGEPRASAAPGATGAGILLSGSDAAEVLYWDGLQWRRLVLGF